ncbi:biliverdin-producing heme oxygenase [Asaia krungthepensis]|uniref:Heme oxygenase n=1 Tax=Asaia krungthepensis NRIC 0535 TaxID=1307925 RepID=A0ABQ0Q229_9PROT|nr:biliverdin-producing heme oxygenase [Asaia krungthepensis]GBQ87602.1 hypothetical protein AA0535_1323 [Asaia krungthepensis NRIC 0535]
MLKAEPSRRATLRRRVHEAHEQLDHSMGDLGSAQDYERYLKAIAAFRFAAEHALAGHDYPEWFGGWRPVATSAELEKDLEVLGLAAPVMPPIQRPGTESELLGMLYTLEGSALGARLIARRAAALGYDGSNGASHLSHQTSSPDNWRDFLLLLEKSPEFDEEEAGSAASTLFRHAREAVTLVDRAEEEVHG